MEIVHSCKNKVDDEQFEKLKRIWNLLKEKFIKGLSIWREIIG